MTAKLSVMNGTQFARHIAHAMENHTWVSEEETELRKLAAMLVPKGSVYHAKIIDLCEFELELDTDDELYDTEEIEVVIAVSALDYPYAEERLDSFREKLAASKFWGGMAFGVTLHTFEEEDEMPACLGDVD